MDTLKVLSGQKITKRHKLTKVQKFYSEFNSDLSTSQSGSSSDEEKVFRFNSRDIRYHAITHPRKHNLSEIANGIETNARKHNNTKEFCSRLSQNNITPRAPQSPGISANQNLKDHALDLIFQKKIKDLKSKLNIYQIADFF